MGFAVDLGGEGLDEGAALGVAKSRPLTLDLSPTSREATTCWGEGTKNSATSKLALRVSISIAANATFRFVAGENPTTTAIRPTMLNPFKARCVGTLCRSG